MVDKKTFSEVTPIRELEIDLQSLMEQSHEVVAALTEYIQAIQDGEPASADRFCRCSQFPLHGTVKTFLEINPFISARKLARQIAKMIFDTLWEEAVKAAAKEKVRSDVKNDLAA